MSRILFADDSPNAQRMGMRILREEGFEVVSVTDGDTALIRLLDVDPDVILADAYLPNKSGYQLCELVKSNPRYKHVRVVLTAGALEPIDEAEAKRVGCDGILEKPFEASAVIDMLKPLVEEAQFGRGLFGERGSGEPAAKVTVRRVAAPAPEIDPERVRAAITLALDAALPAMIEEITTRVLIALGH